MRGGRMLRALSLAPTCTACSTTTTFALLWWSICTLDVCESHTAHAALLPSDLLSQSVSYYSIKMWIPLTSWLVSCSNTWTWKRCTRLSDYNQCCLGFSPRSRFFCLRWHSTCFSANLQPRRIRLCGWG